MFYLRSTTSTSVSVVVAVVVVVVVVANRAHRVAKLKPLIAKEKQRRRKKVVASLVRLFSLLAKPLEINESVAATLDNLAKTCSVFAVH